jgi:hypothetical protein
MWWGTGGVWRLRAAAAGAGPGPVVSAGTGRWLVAHRDLLKHGVWGGGKFSFLLDLGEKEILSENFLSESLFGTNVFFNYSFIILLCNCYNNTIALPALRIYSSKKQLFRYNVIIYDIFVKANHDIKTLDRGAVSNT